MNGRRPVFRLRINWTWAHRLTAIGFLTLLILGQQTWFPWFKGSPTSARLVGIVPFVDPLSGLEVLVASRSLTWTTILGMTLTIGVALVMGRVFCGWLCPLGLILDVVDQARMRCLAGLARMGVRVPQFPVSRQGKYWLLALCLLTSAVASVPVFTTVSPINLVFLATMIVPGTAWLIMGAIVALDFLSRRVFCRALCPLGAFYSLVGRFAPFRIWVEPEAEQTLCRQCSVHCPMGIAVMEDFVLEGQRTVNDGECSRCGTCTDRCAGDVLHLGFAPPRDRSAGAREPRSCEQSEV
jgi:ferredoxin-type protein NapH